MSCAAQGPAGGAADELARFYVGASTPTVRCLTDAERDAERLDLDIDLSPAGIAETAAEERVNAQRCAERAGTWAPATSPGTWTCCAPRSASRS